ncbi:hypothetical protein TWF481_000130 [Arthrobotrys musiformis]|uniref:Uncharacterized protein n=1 Tax=Arthrobotrys musiformis TaxID=47236 RepID=A0AAV9WMS7_9PEZI
MATLPAPYKYVIVEKDPEANETTTTLPEFVSFDSLEDPLPVKARRLLMERATIYDLKAARRIVDYINEEDAGFLLDTGYAGFQYYLINICVAEHAPKFSLSLRLGRPRDCKIPVGYTDLEGGRSWDSMSLDRDIG